MKSKLLAILSCKCPRCEQTHLFLPLKNPKNWFTMYKDCSNCQLHFEIEVGFFYGAMYAAYGITVLFGILTVFVLFLLNIRTALWYFTLTPLVILLTTPISFRLSRSLWVHLFIKKS